MSEQGKEKKEGGEEQKEVPSGIEYCWEQMVLKEGGEAPPMRRYFTASFHDGRFYLFGGQKPNKTAINDFHIYDPKNQTFVPGPQEGLPSPRGGHSATLHNGRLYIFGGIRDKVSLNDLFVCDLGAGKWEQISPESESDPWPSPREFHSTVIFNNEMYLFGGSNGTKKYKNDLFKFNFETRKFTLVTWKSELVPEGRAGHLAFIRENELVIFGGYCGDGGFTYLGDTVALPLGGDDGSRAWRRLEMKGIAAATARQVSFALHQGKIYVFGGYAGDKPANTLRVLDIKSMEWSFIEIWMTMNNASVSTISSSSSTKVTKPYARYGHGTSSSDEGDIFVFAGTGSMYLNDIIRFSPLD